MHPPLDYDSAWWPDPGLLRSSHEQVKPAAERLELPLRSMVWGGPMGRWLGVGVGSSIDFQDHRPYLPGDDPRYINWQAYARTGQYTMKLYRQEVSPLVDLVLDVSPSLFFDPVKRKRTLELFYFIVEGVSRAGAFVRCYWVLGRSHGEFSSENIMAYRWTMPRITSSVADFPIVSRIPWRRGSLRVFISDLLYPSLPGELLPSLRGSQGRGMILAPFSRAESDPDWEGNMELVDCESREKRKQRVEPSVLRAYAAAYKRHFEMWKDASRKHAVILARIPSDIDFFEALQSEALRVGAVEVWT